jgi:predicted AlkP superfamily phosphohydrolase/phosphomutase
LNEGVLGEAPFLEQCYDIHRERERMFFDALQKRRHGLVTCVFDLTDRVQHMFFRHLDPDHPAHTEAGATDVAEVIPNLYQDMDALVGQTLRRLKDDDVLFVMSDHGFKSFRYEVDLNAWLHQNGFLAVKAERSGEDLFHDVDWQGTRAFALGFGGIYLNLQGREEKGIVSEGEEANRIRTEIMAGLCALVDERNGSHPVVRVYDAREAYRGPYVGDAPDLVVGFTPGYRAAWKTVTGGVGNDIIADNMRPWSGDHNFNPPDVPGMLFCNRRITADRAHITDIAATVLDLYGVRIPDYMDGQSLMPTGEEDA